MTNIMELKDLRTKEELINYFKALGKNITEEEIEILKQSYKQAEENNSTLTMQQLDDVAGGILMVLHHVSNQEGVKEALLENHKGQLFDTHATERFGEKPIIAQFIDDKQDKLRIMHTSISEKGTILACSNESAEVHRGLDTTHKDAFNPQFYLKNLEINPLIRKNLTTFRGREDLPNILSIENVKNCLLEAARANPCMESWKGYNRAWDPYTKCERAVFTALWATFGTLVVAMVAPAVGVFGWGVYNVVSRLFSDSTDNN